MKYIAYPEFTLSQYIFGTAEFGGDFSFEEEFSVLKKAIEVYGVNSIDTAEMYGEGKTEEILGKMLAPFDREKLTIISKVYPWRVNEGSVKEHCLASLKRLGLTQIDLYLLHWRSDACLQSFIDQAEELVKEGLIKRWGVSNFDKKDMEDLLACQNGDHCFCNQVMYSLGARGIEYDLIPYCQDKGIVLLGYSPLFHNKEMNQENLAKSSLDKVSKSLGFSKQQTMLSFVFSQNEVIPIVKTSSLSHLDANMVAYDHKLTSEEERELEKDFPKPTSFVPLMKI